jgi:hypothetical protein
LYFPTDSKTRNRSGRILALELAPRVRKMLPAHFGNFRAHFRYKEPAWTSGGSMPVEG